MAQTLLRDEVTLTAVQKIADYAHSLRFEDLDAQTVTRARQVMLDTIGTMVGGYQTDLGQLATKFAQLEPGNTGDGATLIGSGAKSGVEGAAFANAVMAKHLGMDDSSRTCGHVAAELIPLLLAIGEHKNLTGRQLITALAAGYDVVGVVEPAVKQAQREKGLDQKSQAGTLASAVTAALALGLDAEQTAQALALSTDMACGTEQYVYDAGLCDTKDLLSGYAAKNGIYAAKMAAFGFRGPPGALDGDYGYFHAFGPGYDETYLDKLGTPFALANTGFKPHAGCRHVHGCVDATHELLKKGRPNLADITAIEIRSYTGAITPSFRVNYDPQTVGQAGFSLPVTVAVVLNRESWYKEDIEAYSEPETRRLWPLVTVKLDDAINAAYPAKNGCNVKITTKDGTVYEGRVEHAKGEPENMLSEVEFEQKFRRLVEDCLPTEHIQQIIDLCSRLESLEDVGDLVKLAVQA
ncbi:MAG: MmgE/PrpD family protein [Deinococcota bacterium]